MSVAPSVLIAAGGTGGHIFPGLAVAKAVRKLAPNASVAFLGTARGLEGKLIPEHGFALHLVHMRPFTRTFGIAPILGVFSLIRATFEARSILRRNRVDVVIGMGGYASLPAIAAARLTGTPSLVHESGAVPGLANKVAARLTRNVAVAFHDAASSFPRPVRVVGMPLDASLASVDRGALRDEARQAFDLPKDARVVLVVGGSLGARRLNELGLELAQRWRDRRDVRILLKAGTEHLETVRRELERVGAAEVVRAVAFIDRMDLAYAAADVAVSRAGAGTVGELPAAGLPAILVPYPHAPDDHQTKNAKPLEHAGAGLIVPDDEAVADRVGPLLEELIADPARLSRMADAARSLSRPGAADEVAAWALELAGVRTSRGNGNAV